LALHHINRVELDFSFPAEEKDKALEQTKKLFTENALPALEKIFEKDEDPVYIERMEIDLGEIHISEFSEKFYSALIENWRKQRTEKYISDVKEDAGLPLSSPFEQFAWFLQRGYWPWNLQSKEDGVIVELINRVFLDEPQLIPQLRQINADKQLIIRRLVSLVTSYPSLQKIFFEKILDYHPVLRQLSGDVLIELRQWFLHDHVPVNSFEVLFELFYSSSLETTSNLRSFIKRIIEKYFIPSVFKEQEQAAWIALVYRTEKATTPRQLTAILGEAKKIFMRQSERKEELMANPIITETAQAKESSPVACFKEENQKINIDNAGLILFHPYLQYVFKELSWVNESFVFTNERCRQKAILFLQFLINGKSRQAEHLLVLNKIICGWPIAMPLKTRINFSATEKQAAQDLAGALIEHWSALKNTSYAGLIKSFVSRKGILQKNKNDYLLQVEKSAIDILLEDLPFGIQTIKLPWNEYIIHVEWSY
jgi:hypothetical protein